MEPQKIKCTNPGCEHMILPQTATHTGGFCMRCVNARAEAQHAEFVRQNRREVNPFAGISDPVDAIVAFHSPRRYAPLVAYAAGPRPIEQLYGALSADEVQRLIHHALGTEDPDMADAIARSLATMTTHDISELQSAWLEAGELWPSVIFRGAPPAVRDEIIRLLDSFGTGEAGDLNVNHALLALSWIGDAVVQRRFAEWERTPPAWSESLFVGPAIYAHTAGWEPRDGGRRDLFHRECLALVAANGDSPSEHGVKTCSAAHGACPWCARPLVNLVELDLRDPRFAFLGFAGSRLAVLTCEVCTAYAEHIFARVAPDGRGVWHSANRRPDYLPDDLPETPVSPWREHRCRLVSRPAILAVEDGSDVDPSQIGGLPTWVQDSAYPKCLDCAETMTFLAQLDSARFSGHEGITYALVCRSCRVTATCYQQT